MIHHCPKHDEPKCHSDELNCSSWMEGWDLFQIQVKLLKAANFEYVDGDQGQGKVWVELCRREDEAVDMITLQLELDSAQLN